MGKEKVEDLKKAIEKLSEQELEKVKTLKEVKKVSENVSTEKINSLPLLYRLELRKALEEIGEDEKALEIDL